MDLMESVKKMSFEDLENIDGIGEKAAAYIIEYFNDEEKISEMESLYRAGVNLKMDNITDNGKLSGKSFLITGSLLSMTRNQAKEIIKKNGGSVKSSVTAKTDYLVIGSNEPETYNSSKKTKALEHKVDIIDEHKILLMSEQ